MQSSFPSPIAASILENILRLSVPVSRILQSALFFSTCPEIKVSAAIFGYDYYYDIFRLLSIGVNGAPSDCEILPLYLHKRLCIHAEDWALRNLPNDFRRYVLLSYSSLAPCYRCARKLYDTGIRAHGYLSEYDDPTGVDYLLDKGVPVYRLDSSWLITVHPDVHLWPSRLYDTYDTRRNQA